MSGDNPIATAIQQARPRTLADCSCSTRARNPPVFYLYYQVEQVPHRNRKLWPSRRGGAEGGRGLLSIRCRSSKSGQARRMRRTCKFPAKAGEMSR
jgi:hypothetical protein